MNRVFNEMRNIIYNIVLQRVHQWCCEENPNLTNKMQQLRRRFLVANPGILNAETSESRSIAAMCASHLLTVRIDINHAALRTDNAVDKRLSCRVPFNE